MIRFALDIHLLDRRGDNTKSSITIEGDCLYDILRNIVDFIDSKDYVYYARLWYIEQSIAELEEHGEGWWNWVKQWYLTPDEFVKLIQETLC